MKFSGLAYRYIKSFILLGICICAVSSVIGYNQYRSSMEKQYNDTAVKCAEMAISYLDTDRLREYIAAAEQGAAEPGEGTEAVMKSSGYTKTQEQIVTLRETMGANDVMVFTIDKRELESYDENRDDWKPMTYIFDSYEDSEKSFSIGDRGGFNPEYIEELKYIWTEGKTVESYFFSEGEFGYNTASLIPVMDGDEVIAIAAAEIPMTMLQSSLRQYLLYAVGTTVILILLFISVYMIYFYRRVISPVREIAASAEAFVESGNRVSDDLRKIDSGDEIQHLAESVVKMQHDIKEYIENIAAVTAEKERIGAELDIAARIQADMLPCIFPAFPEREEMDIFAVMKPAKEVGGDFYDFFMVDERHLAVVMADVSDKGVPAALFMVIGKTLIKDHTEPGRDLGEVFTEVNDLLCEANNEDLFITAFEGVLDLATGEFSYVNAGHETPYICKNGNEYEQFRVNPGFVLAGIEGMEYSSGKTVLEPGDRVFLYTDGVTEAADRDGTLYGRTGLEKVLAENRESSPEELLAGIRESIEEFTEGAEQSDDITMLSLEFCRYMEEKR